MSSFAVTPPAVAAEISRRVPLQIVPPSAEPPEDDDWLHEVKHDGHRLVAVADGGDLKLVGRNGHDRTELFAAPFESSAPQAGPRWCSMARSQCRTRAVSPTSTRSPKRCACAGPTGLFISPLTFSTSTATTCALVRSREGAAARLVATAGSPHLITVDHVVGNGAARFEAMRQFGAEGIVSERASSPYRGGAGRDWLK